MSTNRQIGLLYDSVSPNTGDIAIGIAAQQILRGLGVEGIAVDPFVEQKSSPLIIGGGELIRTSGDNFYDRFRLPGRHILNAVGVWNNADNLDYLKEYAFVSARSTREAETLSKWVPDVQVVPCATTLLKSEKYEIEGIDFSEPVVGIHLAPHSIRVIEELVDIVDSIPHQKVFIPFTHYNGDASFMAQMPFNRERTKMLGKLTPLELHSVLGQMTYSLTTSMHASIFSYSQGVPFVSIFQQKVHNYFYDRGLSEYVANDDSSLRDALFEVDENPPDLNEMISQDRRNVIKVFSSFLETTSSSGLVQGTDFGIYDLTSHYRQNFINDQISNSFMDHDLTLALIELRRKEYLAHLRDSQRKLSRFLENPMIVLLLNIRNRYLSFKENLLQKFHR